MAGGGQFRPGEDARRGTVPPPPKRKRSLMELARAERAGTIRALVRLRDQKDEPKVALEAAKLLMRYADGEPGTHNVPPAPPEGEADGDMDTAPPELSPELEATLDEAARRGGDAGGGEQGNGGGA